MTSETMPSAVPPVPAPAAPSRAWLSAVVLAALLAMPWWISYVAVVRARQMSAIFADLMGDSALPGLTSGVLASAAWWWLLQAWWWLLHACGCASWWQQHARSATE